MKRVKTQFEFDGNTVIAMGTVWDTLFVDNLHIVMEDENYDRVPINKKDVELLNEMAEEMLIEKYTVSSVDEPDTEEEVSLYDMSAGMDTEFDGGSF